MFPLKFYLNKFCDIQTSNESLSVLVLATGAVNGPAGFAAFCCRIAQQLEVVPVS